MSRKNFVLLIGAMTLFIGAVSLLVILAPEQHEPMSPGTEKSCQRDEFKLYADAIADIAEIKSACAWIDAPMRFPACRNIPYTGVLMNNANCYDLRYARQGAEHFVKETAPDFIEACKGDDGCRQWRYSYVGEPTWWNLKSTNETK